MYRRAVAYYERVFLYEPDTNLDARLRAANIYERNLGNSQQAIALYQQILSREIDPDQTREARRRLDLLSKR
jgi:tetratricopeptide (TPR) repeat protein